MRKSSWIRGMAALAVAASLVGPSARPARAAGFLIYDLSGEAIGRASAVSASVADASAVWFNPAQLAFVGGASATVGGVLVTARSSFASAADGTTTNSERGTFFLPTLFAQTAITDRVAVGLGAYTAFGIGIDWPLAWAGRENAIGASLQTFALNPTVAIKLHPLVSFAAGFDAVRAAVDFRNGLPVLIGGDVRLAGGTWGYGFNAAVQVNAIPSILQMALTYRSRVSLDFNGRADFRPDNPEFSRMLLDQPGTAHITLPDFVTLGIMGRPRPDLTLELDVDWARWSAYNHVDINFATTPANNKVLRPDGQDAFTFRVGGDWAASFCRGLHLRAGFIVDQGAIPSTGLGPGLPDADRLDFTAGIGYGRGHFKADLGYMLVHFLDSTATGGIEGPVGKYSTTAQLLGLTFSVAGALGPVI
jgi:long-chain fatty acid transport protein